HGGYLQGFNLQVIVDGTQILLGVDTHDSPTDTQALHPMLRLTRTNLDAAGVDTPIGAALFDAGFASNDNFTAACPDEQTTLYVAVTKEARQTGRLSDHPPHELKIESWRQMRARLDTDEGRALYKQRGSLVEPVFGQLFARLGRHLNYRGPGAHTELDLWAISHNLGKIIKNRVRTAAAPILTPPQAA
ncbi:MAG: transposase, partial [Acidimicrobiales bacterium]